MIIMADGENSREEVNELNNIANKAGGIANNAINKVLSNNATFNNMTNNLADKIQDNNEKLKDNLKDKFNNKKNINTAKEKAGKDISSATGKSAKATKNVGKAAVNGNIGDTVKNMAGAAVSGGGLPKADESETSGEISNKMEDAGKKAVQVAIDAARAASGDPAAIARLIALAIKIGLLIVFGLIAFLFFLIIVLILLVGNAITNVLTNITEAFNVIANKLNPTAIENFSMDDQYKILATAFSEAVMEAYGQLQESVLEEINNYDINPAYNEWSEILEYNRSVSKINYNSIVVRESDKNSATDIGMPQDASGEMVDVFIGGYTGTITDDQFEPNSKKLNRYDLGLYKKDSTIFASGSEPYFDRDNAIDAVKNEAAYAALSDTAYLIAGYSVSMNENPIIDIGTDVSELELAVTLISYNIDIQERLFQSGITNASGQFASGKFCSGMKTLLQTAFGGESTYFKYDPSLIKQIGETKSRWVYEYVEGTVTPCYDWTFTYDLTYKYTDSENCDDPECTDCPHDVEKSGTATVTVSYSRDDDIASVTESGYTPPTASDFIDDAEGMAPDGAYDVSATASGDPTKENEIWVNRSGYKLTEKTYTSWTLTIPMEAFDVDRMMKAIFETNVYWTELTEYYTDQEATYGMEPGDAGYNPVLINKESGQDEILNYYGKYIDKWKYAYYEMEIDYGDNPAGKIAYSEGELFENGIDKQPYFHYDEVYMYDCNCNPNYGITIKCEKCGSNGLRLSKEIAADTEDANTQKGWGERVLSRMTSPLVNDNAFFRMVDFLFIGGTVTDELKNANQSAKQSLMIVNTTTDKLVLDDYTGDQVGGFSGTPTNRAGKVVLETTDACGETIEYYPITVHDRILELKNTALNVLEDSEYWQNLLAKTGLSYSERLNGNNGTGIDVTPMAQYIKDLCAGGSYTAISSGANGEIIIGIGDFSGQDAIDIVTGAKSANPDKFNKLLEDNNITESDFNYWTQLYKSTFPAGISKDSVENVLVGILEESQAIQNDAYNKKVNNITSYLQGQCQVTDPATLALLGAVIMEMGIEDVTDIGHKGELASFNQDIIIGGISAGADNSFETTYQNLLKWSESGNSYATPAVKEAITNFYPIIAADKAADKLPWISNGVVPDDIKNMVDYLRHFVSPNGIANSSNTAYSQGRAKDAYPRMTNQTLWDAITQLVETGTGHVSTDCSAFVASVYWHLGYTVPGSSAGWSGNSLYAARNDWANIQKGDVVVWRNSEGGHVEIYVGEDGCQSIGFGSAPPKEHGNWDFFDSHYGASTRRYYRICN